VADSVAGKTSVLVEGTYKGAAFTFAGHFLAEQGTDSDVTVDAATPVLLAMTVDTSSWFQDATGAPVDPADTTQHDALAVAVCKTLNTQPQTGRAASGSGECGGQGGPGNGGQDHRVEPAP
jgi:hypothetical protein